MKLNQIQVCLDCEEAYVGDYCPKCGSAQYFYLRKYFEPLQRFGGHYEPVKVHHNPVSANIQRLQGNITFSPDSFTHNTDCGEFVDGGASQAHTVTVGQCGRTPSGAGPEPRTLDYTSRVLGEAVRRLAKICRGLDASPRPDVGAQVEQTSTHGPGA